MSLLHVGSILFFGILFGVFSDILWVVEPKRPGKAIAWGILGAFVADLSLLGLSNWFEVFYGFYTPLMLWVIHLIGAYTAVNMKNRMGE